MKLESLDDLFVHHLQDIYSAEKQITRELPKMANATSSPDLEKAFTKHLKETENQIKRLEKVFRQLDRSPGRKKCKGMEGLLEEGASLIEEEPEESVLDAGLISSAQRVEHYEISAYGTAIAWAQLLGYDEAIGLLEQSLEEESAANEKLNALAEGGINQEALEPASVE
jgi:ferritin-like metal-binding protein YciE